MTAQTSPAASGSGAGTPEHSRKEIHRAMCEMPYAHYIIGSTRDGEACGMVADWVTQICFEPRRIAIAFENDAYTLENIRRSHVFSVSLPSADQMDVAATFLQPHEGSKIRGRPEAERHRVHHKMDAVAHHPSPSGCPIVDGSLMWLDCEAEQFIEGGDHAIVLAVVKDGAVVGGGEPLTSAITGWEYGG